MSKESYDLDNQIRESNFEKAQRKYRENDWGEEEGEW